MNRRQIQLLLIFAAFLLPAVVALMLQTRWFHWEPQNTRNRGDLIEPVIALGEITEAATVFADGHRWSVLLRVPAECDAGCARRVALLGRIREAQGKDMDRVQMVAWASAFAPAEAVWTIWQPDADLAARLALDEGAVMLIDPLGNAMMRYHRNADPTDVRKDVAHLLRWSKLGK
jgi:hypothetical protein